MLMPIEFGIKIAEILVTSGIFGMARFKGSDGKYHYGFNGLPSSDRTVKVNGTLESSGATYVGADGLYIRWCQSYMVQLERRIICLK